MSHILINIHSGDGRLLGFGSSDLSIGLMDAHGLTVRSRLSLEYNCSCLVQPLVTILKAHEFPMTTITFNPTSSLLVSGSADHSIRIVSVPKTAGGSCMFTGLAVAMGTNLLATAWGVMLIIILTLIIVLLALATQRYLTAGKIV